MDIKEIVKRGSEESDDAYAWRILYLADSKLITWAMAGDILNAEFKDDPHSNDYWRRKFRATTPVSIKSVPVKPLDVSKSGEYISNAVTTIVNLEKARVRMKDERNALNSAIRKEARLDSLLDGIRDSIPPAQPITPIVVKDRNDGNEMIAMLSDIHYGMKFNNTEGEYNSSVAQLRLVRYANKLVDSAKQNGSRVLHLCLMGDLINGAIHTTGRIENEFGVEQQIVGVSELISDMIMSMAPHFEKIIVRTVNGNHSRVIPQLKESPLDERLDSLIAWYCKAKCANQKNVVFEDNDDSSIVKFEVNDNGFVMVHGDIDKNTLNGTAKIASTVGYVPDYILTAHTHVATVNGEKCTRIVNGSVCGSGDDYTRRNRLSSYPCQISLVVSQDDGVTEVIINNL